MKTAITASMLYDFVQCPHRVTMDLFEDFSKRDPINPFVQLLWEKGNAFEQEVIEGLRCRSSISDLFQIRKGSK